jgi:hypothetical protein
MKKKKIKLLIELEFDNNFYDDKESKKWFYKEVLSDLILHSNNLGDSVGKVKVLKLNGNKEYL